MEVRNKLKLVDIFLNQPLYSENEIKDFTVDDIVNILAFYSDSDLLGNLKTIDSFCIICEKDTTFISEETNRELMSYSLTEAGYHSSGNGTIDRLIKELSTTGTFQRDFLCPRPGSDPSHNHTFLFKVVDSKIVKIGQSPSIADLSKKEIAKYRKLGEEIYQELNRAIGLSSHGIGVGSFVYLRRIIEKHIVLPLLKENLNNDKISKDEIAQKDFKGKINLVRNQLPEFLIKNKKVYSILSKGIHELEEDECNKYFPIMRTAIEIILDEQIEKNEREKKNKKISDQINSIN